MRTDEQGFEIPEDMEMVTEEEQLKSLFYAEQTEYDRLKIDSPIQAEIFKANCIQERMQRYLRKKAGTTHLYELTWDQWTEHRRIRFEKGEREGAEYKNNIILNNLKSWQEKNG